MKDLSSRFQALLTERIHVLDRAMGTVIQRHGLSEADYRGERFAELPWRPQGQQRPADPDPTTGDKGGIHQAYLEAGADILETNTFNANRVSMAELLAWRT